MCPPQTAGPLRVILVTFLALSRTNEKIPSNCVCMHVQALLEAFRSFDLNHDGVITESEVAEGLKKWGGCSAEDVRGMLGLYDTNKDGVIDWEEFLAMMHAKDGSLKQAASFFRELRVPDRVIASLEYGTVI